MLDLGNLTVNLSYKPGSSEFYLHVPYDWRNKAKRIGGSWHAGTKSWRYAMDARIWDDIKKTFKGHLTVPQVFVKDIEEARERSDKFLSMRRRAEDDGPIEFSVNGISLDGKNPLFNYQKWGIHCGMLAGDGFLIGDQPGLGKSIQALGIALNRRNNGQIKNCLIICLASLKYNWIAEISKFTKEKALVIDGTAEERRKQWMASGYFFKIANYESIVRDLFIDTNSKIPMTREETEFRKYVRRSFDMIVVDEIHAIKNHSAQRTRALKQFQTKYRVGLSGTPVDGHLEELHSIFEFLKPGLFESKSRFMNTHAIFDPFGSIKAYIGVDSVRKRIEPYYLRRLKEKVLSDLPEKLYKDVYVELKPRELKLYKKVASGAHEITEEAMAAAKILRARQFLDFPEILDMRNPSAKFLALADLLEELIDQNDQKVLIFTQYKEVLDLIVKNLSERYKILQIHGEVSSKERVELVEKFNNDRSYPILIGTDAMSTGLNIGGANAVIHYEDSYSPALMQQRNDRAHRATTRHNVTIYRFICKGTIEEKVRTILGDKMTLNNRLLDENCSEFSTTRLTGLSLLQYL